MPTADTGLTHAEAAARLAAHGPNRLVRQSRVAQFRELLAPFADPMALMLAGCAAVYFLLGEARDAWILIAALIPVLGVDVLLEARSRGALRKLASQIAPRATVVRQGAKVSIPTEDLVPGDLLVLTEGDVVHADGIVRSAANLSIDEASLTGESEPQTKQSHPDLAAAPEVARFWAGSVVLTGHGRGEVTMTGRHTRFGETAALVAEVREDSTPLQQKVNGLFRRLGIAAGCVAIFVGALALWRGEGWGAASLSAASLAMAALPEEFPLVLTLFLSLGAWRLSKRGVLVRRLSSVETLGSTTVICVDKTGTLTSGRFGLDRHEALASDLSELEVLEVAALACEIVAVDPMDRAIVDHCATHGLDLGQVQTRWEMAFDHDFDPVGKHMSHVWRNRSGTGARIAAKGALEGILEHCRLTETERRAADAANQRLAGDGMRVLAVAGRDDRDEPLSGDRIRDERNLRLIGLLGFRDPIRPEVPATVRSCQDAGVAIKMITGDHAFTAHAIASAAGIRNAERVVTGAELASLTGPERARRIADAAVFARVQPAQKHAIVGALQSAGEIVAMTGDGINDAPALRRADIGVSMGARATEVARAVADLVLLDDDFGALISTIAEGRRIYANIRHSFLYLIAFHMPIVVIAVVVPILGMPLLLQPIHLVWLELIVHPVSALIFEAEPGSADSMRRPPRRRGEPLVPLSLALPSIVSGLVLALGALLVYSLRLRPDGELAARGAALMSIVVGSVLLVWTERSAGCPRGTMQIPRGLRFWIIVTGVLASVPLSLLVPSLATMLHVAPASAAATALALCAAVAAVIFRPFWRTTAPDARF